MEIIGRTGSGKDDDFIVTASKEELARIMGFDSTHSIGCPDMETGLEISVNSIYDYLVKISEADQEIKKAVGILKSVASLAEGTIPVFPAPDEE